MTVSVEDDVLMKKTYIELKTLEWDYEIIAVILQVFLFGLIINFLLLF